MTNQHEQSRSSPPASYAAASASVTGGARLIPPGDDHAIPLFFLSYANVENLAYAIGPVEQPGSYNRFFQDLSRCVVALVGRQTGADPGFMYRSRPSGRLSIEELLDALGSCQVFVALLDASYMTSEWCAMEWDAFSQRAVRAANGNTASHETCMIPVKWAKIVGQPVPACVSKIRPFSPADLPDPDTVRRYEEDGVFGLLEFGLDASYRGVVYRIAQRITELYYSHNVEPRRFAQGDLRNIFQE